MFNNTFSFYFNFDYERNLNQSNDREISVKEIVNTFYNTNIGKIVNVTDMKSEYGSFFIITFTNDTLNWSNPTAYNLYNLSFENNEILTHKIITEYPITFKNSNGYEWQIFLTSFPNFTIDNFEDHSDLIGEWTYDIMWNIQEYGEETDTFNINKKKIHLLNKDIEPIDDEYNNNNNNSGDLIDTKDMECENRWLTEEEWDNNDNLFNEKNFYESWAKELDELSSGIYDNSFDETWKPIEYRYDLCDMTYNTTFPSLNGIISNSNDYGIVLENGYTVYNKCEFIDYYGKKEGEKRWNSNIYSAPCFTEGDAIVLEPPVGCQFIYNTSYLILKCCLEYNNETDFNMNRAIIRKYVDTLWSFTDPTDETHEQKPIIKLRADYNNEHFNLSCWHTFQYTNLKGERKLNIEKIIQNFKSYGWDNSNMIDWIPSSQ